MRVLWCCLVAMTAALTMALAGCENNGANGAPPPPPAEVFVSLPIYKDVVDYEDFTGRTEAIKTIEVRARATGYLQKINFTDGTLVTQDQVLFEIDARPYEAELNRVESALVQAEARLNRLDADLRRAESLLQSRAIGREEYDKIVGDRKEAQAAIGVAKANRVTAELNLSFTKVMAPISGRASRRQLDPGNLIKADDTVLTTIVALQPMYAVFEVDERTLLKEGTPARLIRLLDTGKIKSAREQNAPVWLARANEEGFPRDDDHKGVIDFIDNRIDSGTGTLRVRAEFPNAKNLFSPGLFVRVRVELGQPYKAGLVAERALSTDQGQKVVYVVDAENKVVYRQVKLGALHDGLRVIEGVQPTERVIVSGLQRVRSGDIVQPKLIDMPLPKT